MSFFTDVQDDHRRAFEHWEGLSEYQKLEICQDLEQHGWSSEYLATQYGAILEPIPMSWFRQELYRLTVTPKQLPDSLEGRLDATPLKKTLLNLSQTASAYEAIAELVDNVFDNFDRNRTASQGLQIQILFFSEPSKPEGYSRLVFRENSGGIRRDQLSRLVVLGESYTADTSIGAWGQGAKIAFFALANEVKFFTRYPGEDPICIHFPNGWLQEGGPFWESWKVDVTKASDVPESHSIIEFTGLTERANGIDPEKLKDYLEQLYSHKLLKYQEEDVEVSISIDAPECKAKLFVQPSFTFEVLEQRWGFSWLNEFRPRIFTHDLRIGRESLGLRIKVGLLSRSAQALGGVYMFGNDRLFTPQPLQGPEVGFGGKLGKYLMPRYRGELYRLVVMVFITGKSHLIPWTAPLKNGFNPNAAVSPILLEILYYIMLPYALVARHMREHQYRLFTRRFLESDKAEKVRVLRDCFGDSLGDVMTVGDLARYFVPDDEFPMDIENLDEVRYESHLRRSDLPHGVEKANIVGKFLQKVNDEAQSLSMLDFFLGVCTAATNKAFGEGALESLVDDGFIEEPPDPWQFAYEWLKERERQSRPEFTTAKVRLSPEEREQLSRYIGAPGTLDGDELLIRLKEYVLAKDDNAEEDE